MQLKFVLMQSCARVAIVLARKYANHSSGTFLMDLIHDHSIVLCRVRHSRWYASEQLSLLNILNISCSTTCYAHLCSMGEVSVGIGYSICFQPSA